ncbi:DUF86 domain-containing protein [Methylobacterium sp. J-068]|uniref:HepT-like ribonuclease domain-containing protein n=1 Tax=Methylobacterium sp. J-068 TaxID=2836649 RepID=UPI003919F6C4
MKGLPATACPAVRSRHGTRRRHRDLADPRGCSARARHPGIPWRNVADAGNFYRHADHRVALDIVWKTVHDHLKPSIAACHAELSRPPAP